MNSKLGREHTKAPLAAAISATIDQCSIKPPNFVSIEKQLSKYWSDVIDPAKFFLWDFLNCLKFSATSNSMQHARIPRSWLPSVIYLLFVPVSCNANINKSSASHFGPVRVIKNPFALLTDSRFIKMADEPIPPRPVLHKLQLSFKQPNRQCGLTPCLFTALLLAPVRFYTLMFYFCFIQ